jgi:hypothetical protein
MIVKDDEEKVYLVGNKHYYSPKQVDIHMEGFAGKITTITSGRKHFFVSNDNN